MLDSHLEQCLTCCPCSSFSLGAYSFVKTVALIVAFALATAASFIEVITPQHMDFGFATLAFTSTSEATESLIIKVDRCRLNLE